ncbi:MAG: hypothetical protein LLF86_05360 [Nitrospiraceae bacterium]|nr:hypothetical protein [Nitrospiraceae bacterium]
MQKDIFIFLFAAGLLFFGWPMVEIFRSHLPQYLFGFWLLFIGAVAAASLRRSTKKSRGQ